MAKKSVLNVDEVRRLYESGLTIKEIGKVFCRSKSGMKYFNTIYVRQNSVNKLMDLI
jgi:hypothetical protein